MTNTIGTKLTALVAPLVTLFFAEGEADTYPYAVYNMTAEPVHTKDAVYKIGADVTINIYAADFATAARIEGQIRAAISQGMRSAQYSARLQEESNSCSEGVWNFSMNYKINQYQ